jgi:hypothetical protein
MGEATEDHAYRAEIAAIAEELQRHLPAECRSLLLGADADAAAAALKTAARDGIDDVLARLKAGSEDEVA